MIKIFYFLLLSSLVINAQTLTFGVFTYRSAQKIMEEYTPVAQHISHELNVSVLIKPLSQEELEKEVEAGNIDIIATNPTHYLSLQKQGKTTGDIATLVKRYGDVVTPYLGGVIFTRAKRRGDIRSISELKEKTIAIPGESFLGGFQAQAYELLKAKIDVKKDIRRVIYGNHEAVVNAVLSKEADAGFVRSGIIEEMVFEGRLKPEDIFIVNEQNFSHFPMKVSTNLYPEWSIVAAKALDLETVSKVAIALYGYKNPHKGNGIISGFTISGDYFDVDVLARELRIPPYNHVPAFTNEDIWQKHGDDFMLFYLWLLSFFLYLHFCIAEQDLRKNMHNPF